MTCYNCYTQLDHCPCDKRALTLQEYVEAFRHNRELTIWERRTQVMITVSFETAEYLQILIGQVPWGNQKRRGLAAAELGRAMGNNRLRRSLECFDNKANQGRQ